MRTRGILAGLAALTWLAAPGAASAPAEWQALGRAIADLSQSPAYSREYGRRFAELEAARRAGPSDPQLERRFQALRREALLANPLLDFDRILLVRRGAKKLGLPQNWEGNQSIKPGVFDNQIAVLSGFRGEPALHTIFRPTLDRFVGDLELHYDAGRLMFSMRDSVKGPYRIYEIGIDGAGMKPIPQIDEPDVHNYDAVYLPSGKIIFSSTAPFTGVPCVTGASHVANLYLLDPRTGGIRRLTFDQEHNWCPTVLNDGRILYQRWEYSDLPHFASRLLFHMDPDGMGQMEFYGSNSYWPNATFYARPIPNHPSRFVGVVGGHHGAARMGELVLFDSARSRHEAEGVVQRIPGFGRKVDPIILDQLVDDSWPKFLHPYPLSDKYFLVSAQLSPASDWGVYLVDVFDNLLLLKSEPGYALLEPIPLRKTRRQPVIPDRVDPKRKDALVFLQDIYRGEGLKGAPRGSVRKLRVITYHFSYHDMGGQENRVGLDGPWDIKRVMGTVPVEPDGSAYFRAPANMPITVQPLDAEGKAIQWMRSWLTAMPGETVSCVGCHERQNLAPASRRSMAVARPPSEIQPWYGPTRGFSFRREVQPVLNRYCVSCHDGARRAGMPDFRPGQDAYPEVYEKAYKFGSKFPVAYLELRQYVRPATIEPDLHMLAPYEFHADTAKLVQMLGKGHHGVKLDAESWDRLITWIDLNTPAHGSWSEIVGPEKVATHRARRREMLRRYASLDDDPEQIIESPAVAWRPEPRRPDRSPQPPLRVTPAAAAPLAPPAKAGRERTIDLGGGLGLKLRYIAGGAFRMGDAAGLADERPASEVAAPGFWAGAYEITNAQYALFDPAHDSRIERSDFLHFSDADRGWRVNGPSQPVCRVSWREALEFCAWLSRKTGERFRLPTEAEWEYAARAGSSGPLWYGEATRDFAPFANLADHMLRFPPWAGRYVPAWRPAAAEVNDSHRVSAPVGSYDPNPWGLYDVHGNVAEWTQSLYRAYPYRAGDGREDLASDGRRVVRGGSWYDRPEQARSAFRKAFHPWQGVFDVGFRVVCEGAEGAGVKVAAR